MPAAGLEPGTYACANHVKITPLNPRGGRTPSPSEGHVKET